MSTPLGAHFKGHWSKMGVLFSLKMHKTLHSSIKGYIDSLKHTEYTTVCRGWCLNPDSDEPLLVRAQCAHVEIPIIFEARPDVDTFYKKPTQSAVGWNVTATANQLLEIQVFLDDDWKTVFIPAKAINTALSKPAPPTCIVLDNVYEAPDDIRAFALTCDLKEHSKFHKGKRTDECYRFPGLKERFEQVLGRKITGWDTYGTNGCFQYCIGGDQLVYHNDTQQYAGVLYLTPNAPPEAGTHLYRSKHTKSMNGFTGDYMKTYPTGHLDPSQFELVDVVGNVYNRLILFDAHMIHAAASYFGDSKENGRLFQLFFFDLE